jgi:hypothetical protein
MWRSRELSSQEFKAAVNVGLDLLVYVCTMSDMQHPDALRFLLTESDMLMIELAL